MPHLILLRHAKSSWDRPELGDFDRPLAPRGERAAPLVGRWIARKKWRPALVLCSTARRARETLALVAAELPEAPQVRYLKTLYLASPSRITALLQRQPAETASIMVVGHNPGMENLSLHLAAGESSAASQSMAEKFPTAALAHFKVPSWLALGREGATLKHFIRPRDLE